MSTVLCVGIFSQGHKKDINFCFYTKKNVLFSTSFFLPRSRGTILMVYSVQQSNIQHLICVQNAFDLFELNCTILLLFKSNWVCLSLDMVCIHASGALRLFRHTFLSIILGNYSIFILFSLCLVTRKYTRKHFFFKKLVNRINLVYHTDTEKLCKSLSFITTILRKACSIGLVS